MYPRPGPPWPPQPPSTPGPGWCQFPPLGPPPCGHLPLQYSPVPNGWGMPPGLPQWGWQGAVQQPSYHQPVPSFGHHKQWSGNRKEAKGPALMHRRRGGGVGAGRRGGGGKGEGEDEGDFSCTACSKSYKERQHFESHIRSHKKHLRVWAVVLWLQFYMLERCTHPGCEFEAVHKVLNDHVLIHTVPKELFFDTPEEIAKWRDERRRNYPTRAAVARKLAEQREKEERGDVLPTRMHRYQGKGCHKPHWESGRFGRGRWRGRGRGHQRVERGKTWSRHPQPIDQLEVPASEQLSTKPWLKEETRFESEDVTSDKPEPISDVSEFSSEQVPVCDAGVGLNGTTCKLQPLLREELASEGEISDDDDDSREKAPPCGDSCPAAVPDAKRLEMVTPDIPSLSALSQAAESDAVRGNQAGIATALSGQRRSIRSQLRPRAKKRLTLLEKLLAPEIRRERNALLQCIRFVVRNNFFDSTAADSLPHCPQSANIPVTNPASLLGRDSSHSEGQN